MGAVQVVIRHGQRLGQRIQRAEVVVRGGRFSLAPVPAIGGVLLHTARCQEIGESVRLVRPIAVELEHLGIVVARVDGGHEVQVGREDVLQYAAVGAVHIDLRKMKVARGQPKLFADPRAVPFDLARAVPAVLARLVEFQLGNPQEAVRFGQRDRVRSSRRGRGVVAPSAAVAGTRIVDHAVVLVDKGHLERFVAAAVAGCPFGEHGIGHPYPVGAHAARRRGVAEAHQAFRRKRTRQGLLRVPARRRRSCAVNRLDCEREQFA